MKRARKYLEWFQQQRKPRYYDRDNKIDDWNMDEAVRRLQDEIADLEHQWKRQAHLDHEGVYHYDERHKQFRKSVVLTREARAFTTRRS